MMFVLVAFGVRASVFFYSVSLVRANIALLEKNEILRRTFVRSAIIADRREAKNNIAILLGKTAKPKAFQEKSMRSQIVKMLNEALINSENRYSS